MKFFQNKKKKEINKLADKIIRRAKKEESSREELFRCTECGKDPCWVEEKNAG